MPGHPEMVRRALSWGGFARCVLLWWLFSFACWGEGPVWPLFFPLAVKVPAPCSRSEETNESRSFKVDGPSFFYLLHEARKPLSISSRPDLHMIAWLWKKQLWNDLAHAPAGKCPIIGQGRYLRTDHCGSSPGSLRSVFLVVRCTRQVSPLRTRTYRTTGHCGSTSPQRPWHRDTMA